MLKVATCPTYLCSGKSTPESDLSEMHPLPILPPTCCRTLAVSSGKVITSATQAAKPAEKILTPMVGCASAAVAPSILAQIAERALAPRRKAAAPKVEVQSLCPFTALSSGSNPLSHPGELGGWQPGGPRRAQGGGGAQECGRAGQCLPPHPLPRNTGRQRRAPCPRWGTYVVRSSGLSHATSPKTRAWDLRGGPWGAESLPPAGTVGVWGASLHPESTQSAPERDS